MAQKFLNGIDVSSTTVINGDNLSSGSTVLDVQGSQGQLFSVTNNLTGDLFSVSDVSGVPILNVNSSGAVKLDGYIDSDLEVHGQLKITSDGSNAVTFTESGNGDFTIDAPDDIRIDAGGGDVVLRAAGTEFSRLKFNNPGLNIESSQTNSNLYLSPDGTGNVYANTDTFIVNATEGEAASILLRTDEGDDDGDDWYIYNGTDNTLNFRNDISGSQVNLFTLTPHATSSSSIANFAGKINATSGSGHAFMLGNSNNTTTADTSGLRLHQTSYTDGRWSHRFRKYDQGAGVPLYIDASGNTANIFTALARFGTYSGEDKAFEVFGKAKATHFYGDGSNLTNVPVGAHNHDTLYSRKYTFSPGSNANSNRVYVKLFTLADYDASVVGKLSAAGDYGDSDRATYEIQIATRNNISFDVYQLSKDAVSDDYEFFYKEVSSTYEIWCKMGDYNQPNTFTKFSDYGTVTYNFDSETTTEPSSLTSVTKYNMYHEGHKPTPSEIGAAADTVVNQSDFVSKANGGTFGGNVTIKHASSPSLTFTDDSPDPDNVGKISVANNYMDYSLDNTDVTDSSRMRFRLDGANTVEILPNTTYFRQTNIHLQNTAVSNINFSKNAAITAGDDIGKINFRATNDECGNYISGANIICEGDGTWDLSSINNAPTRLKIQLRNSSGAIQNAMMLSSNLNANFYGDLTVAGDLIVSGTTTTLNTTTVEVEDNILQLNTTQGTPDTATAATSGISIYRGVDENDVVITQASLIFDDGDDTWDLTNNLVVAGTVIANGVTLTGDQTLPTDFVSAANGGTFAGSVNVAETLAVGSGSSRFIWHSGTSLVSGSGTANATEIDWKQDTHYIPSLAYAFRVNLVVQGTGTDTGASYIVYYNNTDAEWKVRYITLAGTSSNHAQLTMVTDSTGPYMAAYHTHSGDYNIRYFVETFDSGDQDMDGHTFGSDFHWQRNNDTLSYSEGDIIINGSTSDAGAVTPRTLEFTTNPTVAGLAGSSGYQIGEICFTGKDSSTNAAGKYSRIRGSIVDSNTTVQGSGGEGGKLQFTLLKHDGGAQPRVEYDILTLTPLVADVDGQLDVSGNIRLIGGGTIEAPSSNGAENLILKAAGGVDVIIDSNGNGGDNEIFRVMHHTSTVLFEVQEGGEVRFQDGIRISGTEDRISSVGSSMYIGGGGFGNSLVQFSGKPIPDSSYSFDFGASNRYWNQCYLGTVHLKSALLSNQENTDIDTGAEVVAEVAHATYTAAFFDFVVKKGTNVRSGTVYACHDGDTTPLVEFTETSTQDLGDTSDVVLSVDISGANMRLLATVASDDWSVKSLIRAI